MSTTREKVEAQSVYVLIFPLIMAGLTVTGNLYMTPKIVADFMAHCFDMT
jgi:hypothetical protein